MSLLIKLRNGLAKAGMLGLRNASESAQDDLTYVKNVVKAQGANSFQYASDYIKSDAESILEMVAVDPEILVHCSDVIYDRYVNYDYVVDDEEVDRIIFAFQCLLIDETSIAYFTKEIREKCVSIIRKGEVVKGIYHGKPFELDTKEYAKEFDMVLFLNDMIEDKVSF